MTHSLPGATGGRVKAMGRFFPSRRAAAFTVWTFSYSRSRTVRLFLLNNVISTQPTPASSTRRTG